MVSSTYGMQEQLQFGQLGQCGVTVRCRLCVVEGVGLTRQLELVRVIFSHRAYVFLFYSI